MDAFLKAACPRCDCAIEESHHEITFVTEMQDYYPQIDGEKVKRFRAIHRPVSYVCRLDGTPMGSR